MPKPMNAHLEAVIVRDPSTPNYSQAFWVFHTLKQDPDDGVTKWMPVDTGHGAEHHGADDAMYHILTVVEGWSGHNAFVSLNLVTCRTWGTFDQRKDEARHSNENWPVPL